MYGISGNAFVALYNRTVNISCICIFVKKVVNWKKDLHTRPIDFYRSMIVFQMPLVWQERQQRNCLRDVKNGTRISFYIRTHRIIIQAWKSLLLSWGAKGICICMCVSAAVSVPTSIQKGALKHTHAYTHVYMELNIYIHSCVYTHLLENVVNRREIIFKFFKIKNALKCS